VVRSGTGAPAELFYEDLTPGTEFDLGETVVDGDEMVEFARRYDPQWYHVDAESAADSPYGGLIASGFFTAALFMRAYVDGLLARAAAAASPGLEEVRWLAAVYAGDRLSTRLRVLERAPSARPGLGTVTLEATMTRGSDGQDVLRVRLRGWFAIRPT
jgi:acyl dehydratase